MTDSSNDFLTIFGNRDLTKKITINEDEKIKAYNNIKSLLVKYDEFKFLFELLDNIDGIQLYDFYNCIYYEINYGDKKISHKEAAEEELLQKIKSIKEMYGYNNIKDIVCSFLKSIKDSKFYLFKYILNIFESDNSSMMVKSIPELPPPPGARLKGKSIAPRVSLECNNICTKLNKFLKSNSDESILLLNNLYNISIFCDLYHIYEMKGKEEELLQKMKEFEITKTKYMASIQRKKTTTLKLGSLAPDVSLLLTDTKQKKIQEELREIENKINDYIKFLNKYIRFYIYNNKKLYKEYINFIQSLFEFNFNTLNKHIPNYNIHMMRNLIDNLTVLKNECENSLEYKDFFGIKYLNSQNIIILNCGHIFANISDTDTKLKDIIHHLVNIEHKCPICEQNFEHYFTLDDLLKSFEDIQVRDISYLLRLYGRTEGGDSNIKSLKDKKIKYKKYLNKFTIEKLHQNANNKKIKFSKTITKPNIINKLVKYKFQVI